MTGRVENLYHYPIKGLSAQPLDTVTLTAGQGFPLDRAFGLARPNSGFNPQDPKPLPKTKFVVLARDAALARLKTKLDGSVLSIAFGGTSQNFDISTPQGRDSAAKHVADCIALPDDMRPTLYSAEPHKFTDVSVVSPAMMNAVSLINADSVAVFSKDIGHDISPARFRGNIVFSGLSPLSELEMVDRSLEIGEATLKIVRRTKRCPATEVNLETGERDVNVPKLLRDTYGHSDMGVYADVVQGGTVSVGDALRIL